MNLSSVVVQIGSADDLSVDVGAELIGCIDSTDPTLAVID